MADPLPSYQTPYGISAAADPPSDGAQIIHLLEKMDGGVDIAVMDGAPPEPEDEPIADSSFDENLAERLELSGLLDTLASQVLEGIDADERSREGWVQNYNEGLDLLGLKITKSTQVSTETLSSVTHPLLLESCLRTRALTRGEILPAAGPAKVKNDGDETDERQTIADQLESDLNHWLTVTASEYYPDTDRGLIYLAFGGDIFKKVYRCPLRRRPVSECVYLPDLIVSQDATDLANAVRITHRIEMSRQQVDRLIASGAYADVTMVEPTANPPAIDRKEKEIIGVSPVPQRQEDYQRTIYECYTDLDLTPHVKEAGAPEGIPLPYRITIDKDARKVLELRRNWKEGDPDFRKRKRFVKWPFMPGMGFYDLGYLHILGQHAKALTALLRICIDAGMLGNFPGGVKLRGARTDTNQIRPAPGEFVEVDGGGVASIRDVIMPLPYKDLSAVLLQLMQGLEEDARKLAGVADLQAGEGRTNVPVGTVMAMIEQQTQMMTAVHKGLHSAQQEEFILLRELFMEDPESLWRDNPQASRQWKAQELADMSFVPASDPNVPAQIHRTMQGMALAMLSQNSPLYNQFAVQKRLLETLHIANPDELLVDPQQLAAAQSQQGQQQQGAGGVPPEVAAQLAAGQLQAEAAKNQTAQQKVTLDYRAKLADGMRQLQQHMATLQKETSDSDKDRKSREAIAVMQAQTSLILKGIEALGQQTSPDPLYDDKAGP